MSPNTRARDAEYELLGGIRRMSDDLNRDSEIESTIRHAPKMLSPSSELEGSEEKQNSTGGPQRNRLNDWFVWEILGVVVSAGILIAIIAVLASYNNKPQPSWKYMSLNSLISWLSTISKACILASINEGLGQLKWVWFAQKSRPIHNLRTFDFASRGLYGGLGLIWILRARHFAIFGSLAVILAIGFDPFTQNLIHSFPNMVEDASQRALVGNVSIYESYGPESEVDTAEVDPVLKANLYNALFNIDQSKPWAIPQYFCSTSNCTWDPIASLEAQAFCSDITDRLEKTCKNITSSDTGFTGYNNCTITIPSSNTTAWFVENTSQGDAFVSAGVASRLAEVYTNSTMDPVQFIAPRGLNTSSISGMMPNASAWEATECTIEPVVRSFNASVKENTYTDKTLATWTNRALVETDISVSHPEGWYLTPPWGSELGMPANHTFVLHIASATSIQTFLQTIFSGYMERGTLHTEIVPTVNGQLYAAADVLQALAEGSIVGCGDELVNRLNCSMQNVAQAISKTFRDSAYIDANSNIENADMASGHAMSSVSYISIHWQWIALPVVVWFLGAVVLVGTFWKTRRANVPRWKNDPLPLLFISHDQLKESHRHPGEVDNQKVRLYKSDGQIVLGV